MLPASISSDAADMVGSSENKKNLSRAHTTRRSYRWNMDITDNATLVSFQYLLWSSSICLFYLRDFKLLNAFKCHGKVLVIIVWPLTICVFIILAKQFNFKI